jgi:hypothetical protein
LHVRGFVNHQPSIDRLVAQRNRRAIVTRSKNFNIRVRSDYRKRIKHLVAIAPTIKQGRHYHRTFARVKAYHSACDVFIEFQKWHHSVMSV